MLNIIAGEIKLSFLLIVLCAIFLFFKAHKNATRISLSLVLWSLFIGTLSYKGYFSNPDGSPLRIFISLSFPVVLTIIGLTPKGVKWMLENRNPKWSTLIHIIRIPVELVLFYLFTIKMVPELMTFEGRNFDILAGVTSCIMGGLLWFNKVSPKAMLLWNFCGLGLILFILINAVLSAPLPIQQFAFDQPNIAILYFPISLLPGLLVPLVIYTHVTDIIYWNRKKVL